MPNLVCQPLVVYQHNVTVISTPPLNLRFAIVTAHTFVQDSSSVPSTRLICAPRQFQGHSQLGSRCHEKVKIGSMSIYNLIQILVKLIFCSSIRFTRSHNFNSANTVESPDRNDLKKGFSGSKMPESKLQKINWSVIYYHPRASVQLKEEDNDGVRSSSF